MPCGLVTTGRHGDDPELAIGGADTTEYDPRQCLAPPRFCSEQQGILTTERLPGVAGCVFHGNFVGAAHALRHWPFSVAVLALVEDNSERARVHSHLLHDALPTARESWFFSVRSESTSDEEWLRALVNGLRSLVFEHSAVVLCDSCGCRLGWYACTAYLMSFYNGELAASAARELVLRQRRRAAEAAGDPEWPVYHDLPLDRVFGFDKDVAEGGPVVGRKRGASAAGLADPSDRIRLV